MSVAGSLSICGVVPGSSGSGPPGSGEYTSVRLVVDGAGGPTSGINTFVYAPALNCTGLTSMLLNNVPLTVDDDFTFVPGTATFTMPFNWVAGQVIVFSFKSA
jgi:hypothetical protein